VAMALLGSVLIAIVSLFFLGRRTVYSGKQMTQAVSVGTRILEDLSGLNKEAIYNGAFNIPNTGTGGTFTIAGETYTNSRLRSTKATIIPSPPADVTTQWTAATDPTGPDFLGKWRTHIGPGSKLQDATISLILTPIEDPTNTPAQFKTATMMRVRVLIQWKESMRARKLVLDTVKPF